jgi:hypothetical protein
MNNFLVQADSENNRLRIVLDGFFVKSEIELAFCLLRIERKKLQPGFDVFVDIENLKYLNVDITITKTKMKKILKLAGAGRIQFARETYSFVDYDKLPGGFYPN